MYVFKGFTEKANKVLNAAIEFAQSLGHTYIGSEHILLGLLGESEGMAAKVLSEHGVAADKVRSIVESIAGKGESGTVKATDMTPRTKKIIEASS